MSLELVKVEAPKEISTEQVSAAAKIEAERKERERLEAEKAEREMMEKQRAKRAADAKHRLTVTDSVIASLIENDVPAAVANRLATVMASGEIPHVTINY